MERLISSSPTYKNKENLSATDFCKYLDFDYERSLFEEEKTLTKRDYSKTTPMSSSYTLTQNSVKEDLVQGEKDEPTTKTQEDLQDDHKISTVLKYKRQNILLKYEIQALTEKINDLAKNHQKVSQKLKKSQTENSKLKKIVKYVKDEILENFGDVDFEIDTVNALKNVFDKIKNTIISTQDAFLNQKEIIKKIRSQNYELKKENYMNLKFILNISCKNKNSSELKGYSDTKAGKDMNKDRKKTHYKSNSAVLDTQNSYKDLSWSSNMLYNI